MFLYEALRQTVDVSQLLKVLDLCAAPGGKSTLLADFIGPNGLLVANETIRTRTGALRENLEKWGYPKVAVTSAESEDFAPMEGFFDIVVTDAPCSGEGLFRKDPNAVKEWSMEQVSVCAARQQRILSAAVECLAPGGILVYSTCTYNPQENTNNVAWLQETFPLTAIKLDIPEPWGITPAGGGYQFYAHRLRGEGFFLAVLRKSDTPKRRLAAPASFRSISPLPKSAVALVAPWLAPGVQASFFQTPSGEILALPTEWLDAYLMLDKYLKIKWFGTSMGTLKGKDFIPDHSLALSQWVSVQLSGIELPLDLALRFLKKETFDLPEGTPNGWQLVRFQGLNLGWIKVLPNRMNNYLPQERRIRMDINGQP